MSETIRTEAVAPEPLSAAPTASLPTVPAPAAAPAVEVDREQVVCPECGNPAEVTLNRRDAVDFCARCDYPLFWTPSAVIRDSGAGTGESLRRLPGAAGRVTVASVPCPTCAESNLVGAELCVRCGGPMVLPLAEPEPEPVVVAEPEPLPPLEPEPTGVAWWWWVVGAATLVALIALIVVAIAR